ncbi:sulfurtransferase TusA family protein [Anaerocolumna sedimenticola]|uniref:Sulfurtransferase TusA family protein n=1 Tax=Anaerocolumna sedimenticola TaxID=2696063 RepID=A0A6P1TJA2_9FIRM|nr:sulfurtransferase TusA family protein [Anaerocolumna sedimenticola]QHQ59996.1 sulfurtransferase TusA family protein [Anaerocolumna sedimenticola]
MSTRRPDGFVDITDVVCPITFVKTKVALEELEKGQILQIKLNDGEPVQNVPRSLKNEKHKIISLNKNQDGTYTLEVIKGGMAD